MAAGIHMVVTVAITIYMVNADAPEVPQWEQFLMQDMVFVGFCFACWIMHQVPAWRHESRLSRGLCPKCEYDFKGDSPEPADECPECGWKRTTEPTQSGDSDAR